MISPDVVARSLPEANDEIMTLGPRCAIVSIGEPGAPTPYGFQAMNPLHLRLEFHDIVESDLILDAGVVPPGPAHVAVLIKHATILRTAKLVYCHCNAGISRSTAVAFILRCLWSAPGEEGAALRAVLDDRPRAEPNRILVGFADELLGRKGAMLAALDQGKLG